MEKLRVGVLSDIHIPAVEPSEKHLYNALSILKQKSAELIVFCGDIVDRTQAPFFDTFNAIVDDVFADDKPQMLFIMGNHDYWTDYWICSSEARTMFMQKLNLDSVDSHIVKKGFHFIGISPEYRHEGNQKSHPQAYYDAQHGGYEYKIQWLKAEIEKAVKDSPDKPIFVFSHYPPSFTLPGTNRETRGSSDALTELLKDYPQVISISGHTHFPLSDERSIHQRDFTSVSASSMYCVGSIGIDIPDKQGRSDKAISIKVKPADAYRKYPTFLYLEADQKQVRIERLYTLADKKCGRDWLIDYPVKKEEFVYTDKRYTQAAKPFFDTGTLIKKIGQGSAVRVMFGCANDGVRVMAYDYTLKDSQNSVVKQEIFYSEIDDNVIDRQKYYFLNFADLPKGDYTLQVFAVGSFGGYSQNSLTLKFSV